MLIDDDADLLSRCRKKDMDAFGILVRKYEKKMLNVAYRMTDDYDDACEIVQEAFLSAYRAIGNFRGEARFSTWLTSITMNHAKNHLRQSRSRSRHEVISLDDPTVTASGQSPRYPASSSGSAGEDVERREIQFHVRECVGLLEEEYKEVLVLRDMEGFSYGEIGHMLKIPEGTVKSRLFRARFGVKECLKKVMGVL